MCEVAVATTGFFDGVHLGHRRVIDTLVSRAREEGREAVVVTFWPHPRAVLQQDARSLRLLTTLEEKKERLLALGVDRVEVLPFSRKFAALTAADYIKLLKEKFNVTMLVMGYDNHIGCDHKTARDFSGAKQALFAPDQSGFGNSGAKQALLAPDPGLLVVPSAHEPVFAPESVRPVSSSLIRSVLVDGRVEDAAEMLGYNYTMKGAVVAGNKLGRTLGFPTANMRLYEPLKLVPGKGVYAVDVEVLGQHFKGMTNVGTRPTVGGRTLSVETHILDFDEDIYGLPIKISFRRRVRDEINFGTLEALKEQLAADALNCKK